MRAVVIVITNNINNRVDARKGVIMSDRIQKIADEAAKRQVKLFMSRLRTINVPEKEVQAKVRRFWEKKREKEVMYEGI